MTSTKLKWIVVNDIKRTKINISKGSKLKLINDIK